MKADIQRSHASDGTGDSVLLEGWQELPLSSLAEIRFSNVDKKSLRGERPVLLCNYIDVYNNDYITPDIDFMEATASGSEISRFSVEPGDVMITKDSETPDDIGVPAVLTSPISNLVCGYHLAQIRPIPSRLNPVFLAKQLGHHRVATLFGRWANGSTRYSLSSASIANLLVRVPPLPQQNKIAKILTTLDDLIEKTEALIAKYQAVKQGMMHDLFTRGVDEQGHLRPPVSEAAHQYKSSPLGPIPKSWNLIQAKDLCGEITKGATPLQVSDRDGEGYRPFIRVQNLTFDGTLSFDGDQLFVPDDVHLHELGRSRVFPGDVLMNLVGPPLGKVSRVPSIYPEWNINQAIAIFRALNHEDSDWLLYYLLTQQASSWLLSRAKKTSGQMNLTLEMSRQLPVPMPQRAEERNLIVSALSDLDRRIKSEGIALSKYRHFKTGLMQDLLTGKVRVHIDPAEEAVHV